MVQKRINLPAPIQQQLTAFCVRIKQHIPDASIILFGSYATNTSHPQSDLDICVITEKFGTNYHDGTLELLKIAHEFPYPMDIIPYTKKDFTDKYDPLAKQIKTTGISIS
jgi:predicted nucleotidyltransferase